MNFSNEVQFYGGFEGSLDLGFEGELVGDSWYVRAQFDRPLKRLQAILFQDAKSPVELTPYKTTPFGSTWHFINSLITFPEYVTTGSSTVWIAVEWDSDNLIYSYYENYELNADYENYEMAFFLCIDSAKMVNLSSSTDQKQKL